MAAEIDDQVEQALFNNIEILKTTTSAFNFQVGAGTVDTITFDLTSSAVGYTTGYTSAQLDVDVGAVTASVSTTYNPGRIDVSLATSTARNDALSELKAGFYTVEVTDIDVNSAGKGDLTFRIRDSSGNIVSIDNDGDGTGSDTDTTITVVIDKEIPSPPGPNKPGASATIDLGVGFKLRFSDVNSTDDPTSFGVQYTPRGNTVSSNAQASAFIQKIDTAIDNVSKGLSFIGAITNKLMFKEDSLSSAETNTEAAKSRILDADMALEQLESTKLQILQQTSTAVLAQANIIPRSVLQLFQR